MGWSRPDAVSKPAGSTLRRFEEIFADLYGRYGNHVRAVIFNVLRARSSAEDREDLEQTVYLKVLEAASKNRGHLHGDLTAYVKTVARNAARDSRRRQPREIALPELPERPASPAGAQDLEAMLEAVEQFVCQLPYDLRVLYEARFVRSLSQPKTAAQLGLSRQSVRTLESRLKRGAIAATLSRTGGE